MALYKWLHSFHKEYQYSSNICMVAVSLTEILSAKQALYPKQTSKSFFRLPIHFFIHFIVKLEQRISIIPDFWDHQNSNEYECDNRYCKKEEKPCSILLKSTQNQNLLTILTLLASKNKKKCWTILMCIRVKYPDIHRKTWHDLRRLCLCRKIMRSVNL